MDEAKRPGEAREGREYWWVPEEAMFKSDGDCLDTFPDLGPACLVVSHVAYDALKAAVERLREELREAHAHIKMQGEARANCQWEYSKLADEKDSILALYKIASTNFEKACIERDQTKVELEWHKTYGQQQNQAAQNAITELNESRDSGFWGRACARLQTKNDSLAKDLAAAYAALEYCFNSMCRHEGEMRPGVNRDWCNACSSWVYPSDNEAMLKVRKALASDGRDEREAE